MTVILVIAILVTATVVVVDAVAQVVVTMAHKAMIVTR
jgi:hypothetical protein